MIRTLTTACAVVGIALGVAACGSSGGHPSHPKGSHTQSAFVQSYGDGLKAGEASAISGSETDGEISANCKVMELSDLPPGGIKSRFLAGCFAGTVLGMVKLDQAGNGNGSGG
jgi:hypothetical protein